MQLPKIFHETYITYLQRVNDLSGQRAPLKELLGLSQTQLVKNLVDNARNAGKGTNDYKKFKNQLPVCVIGGTFKDERPITSNLEHPSGLLTIDIDNITGDELDKTLEVLRSIPYIILTQKSVSGNGCWTAFWYDHNKYSDPAPLWNFIYDELFIKGILIDKQCKDVYTRKRFICSDEFWINPSPTIFDNRIPEKYYKKPTSVSKQTRVKANITAKVTKTNSKWHFGDKTRYDSVPLVGELATYLYHILGEDEYKNVIPNLDLDYKQYLPSRLERWGNSCSRGKTKKITTDSRIWLDKNIKPLIQIFDNNSKAAITLKTTYLSESKEFIKIFEEYINNNNIFILQAPTGTGKTNFIKNYAKKVGGLVLTHTRSLRANYTSDLNLIETSYEKPTAAVMTYDRFVMNYQSISDKLIFIDECHELFNTGGYREKPWILHKNLNEIAKRNKIVLVSATPGYLNDKYKKLLVNTPIRRSIPIRIRQFPKDSRETYIRGIIRNAVVDIDKKTVIYSDEDVRGIMEKLSPIIRDNVELHHSRIQKEYTGNDFLEKPVALCTSLVCNGINFNNKEPIDVYIPIDNTTTCETIIQFVGRFRRSSCITVNLLNFDGYHIEKTKEYLETTWAVEDETGSSVKITKEFQREYIEKNESYLQEHGGWKKIFKELPTEFYIEYERVMDERGASKGNPKKIEITQDIINRTEKEYNEIEKVRYLELLKAKENIVTQWCNRNIGAEKLMDILDDENLNDEPVNLWEFIKNHPVSLETVEKKVNVAVHWAGVSKELFERDKNWFESKMYEIKDEQTYEMLKKRLEENTKNFSKYSGKSVEELFELIIEEWEQHFLKKSKAGKVGNKKKKAVGGSKGGKKGIEIKINGKKYKTKKAAKEALGVSKREFDEMLKEKKNRKSK